jgi:fatty acid-binding protein 3, muscle and heart
MANSFVGDWKLESSENFDNFMKELGVGLVLRKMASATKPNVKITINGNEWTLQTISTLKSTNITFKLNEIFPEETADGRHVKTIFTLEGNGKLIQTQRDNQNKVVCVIVREVTYNNKLKTTARAGSVESVRIYSRA